MGQYIQVATPNDIYYQKNRSLVYILTFVGEKYKETHTGIRAQMMSDFSVGIDFINKQCGKGYKTAIKNLAYSKRKYTFFNAEYHNWKFHKSKAEKFFRILYRELDRMKAPKDIWTLFDYLYDSVPELFPIDRWGNQIISYPYHSALNQVKNGNQYNKDDRDCIARIEKSFSSFDKLYYRSKEEK